MAKVLTLCLVGCVLLSVSFAASPPSRGEQKKDDTMSLQSRFEQELSNLARPGEPPDNIVRFLSEVNDVRAIADLLVLCEVKMDEASLMAHHYDAYIYWCVMRLGQLANEDSILALVRMKDDLPDPDWACRAIVGGGDAAISQLTKIQDPRATALLGEVNRLRKSAHPERGAPDFDHPPLLSGGRFGRMTDVGAIESYIIYFEEKLLETRALPRVYSDAWCYCIERLGKIGSPEAIRELLHLVNTRGLNVEHTEDLMDELSRIGPPVLPYLSEFKNRSDANTLEQLIKEGKTFFGT